MEQNLVKGIAERLRRRDSEAIESLVSFLHGPVYRYLIGCGSNVPQAEELAAETFFQVLRSIEGFRGDDNQVRAFVFSTARNVRTRCYRQTSRMEFDSDLAQNVIDAEELSLQRLLAKERNERVADAFARLSEVAREIVFLRFVEDLSINEIASICDLPAGTVKSHLHRAKQELKQTIAELEYPQ